MSEIPAVDPDEIIPPARHGGADRTNGTEQPTGADGAAPLRGLFPSVLAKFLDELLVIPGTKIRLGLDPLLSFIPVVGDAVATSAGAGILLAAIRHRAPFRLLSRMAGNLGVNALFNVIPLAGPVLSVWFRSNSRNNAMLQDHLAGAPSTPPSPQSRILIGALVALVVLLIALSVFLWITVYRLLDRAFG